MNVTAPHAFLVLVLLAPASSLAQAVIVAVPGPYAGASPRICTHGSSLPAVDAVTDLLRSAGWDR